MMQNVRQLLLLVIAFWTLSSAAQAQDGGNGTTFRRGIAVAHTLAWAQLEPAPSRTYDLRSLAQRSHSMRRNELLSLRRMGFDFIRLAVDPGPFLQFQDGRRDELDRILMDSIAHIRAASLAVIVDFHPSDENPEYGPQALAAGVDTPAFQAYLRLLARTARLLGDFDSDRVALEIMNEAPVPTAVWQPMLDAAYATIRREAARLVIVLGGGQDGAPEGMTALRAVGMECDPAVLFTFHYYEPYQLTHEGAPWNAARHLKNVPYPALARPIDDSLRASTEAIASADLSPTQKWLATLDSRRRIEGYRRSAFDGASVSRAFGDLAGWAQQHGIPAERILLGEFGARRTGLHDDGQRARERAQWFRDVREAAEAQGFGWAAWVYRGKGGFALASDGSRAGLEPAIVDALGLTAAQDQ